jgi:hypothetical protein
METYKKDVILEQSGMLVLEHLPFERGEYVQVIVIRVPKPVQEAVDDSYPLRGTVLRHLSSHRGYDDPFAPVAESEWEVLQ